MDLQLDLFDRDFVKKLTPVLEALYKHYFRCSVSGFEHIPDGAAVYVGNHNGLISFEVLMIFHAWFKRYGCSRRVLGLMDAVVLNHPAFKWLMPRIGAIPARRELALRALQDGYSVLAYPGGLKESLRPFRDRHKVNFFQRKGFIKLALEAGVPIVPIASIGAHESYIILGQSERLAETLGLKDKLRVNGVPITAQSLLFLACMMTGCVMFFPWLLAPASFASIFVPFPAKMSFRFLPPVKLKRMMNRRLSEEQNLQRIYDEIVGGIQETVSDEYRKRRMPIVG